MSGECLVIGVFGSTHSMIYNIQDLTMSKVVVENDIGTRLNRKTKCNQATCRSLMPVQTEPRGNLPRVVPLVRSGKVV